MTVFGFDSSDRVRGVENLLDQLEEEGIEFHVVDSGDRDTSGSRGSVPPAPPLRMRIGSGFSWRKHGKVDKIFDEGDIGTGVVRVGIPFVKKGELFSSLGDRNISIDGVFIVDDPHLLPLGLNGGPVNLFCPCEEAARGKRSENRDERPENGSEGKRERSSVRATGGIPK